MADIGIGGAAAGRASWYDPTRAAQRKANGGWLNSGHQYTPMTPEQLYQTRNPRQAQLNAAYQARGPITMPAEDPARRAAAAARINANVANYYAKNPAEAPIGGVQNDPLYGGAPAQPAPTGMLTGMPMPLPVPPAAPPAPPPLAAPPAPPPPLAAPPAPPPTSTPGAAPPAPVGIRAGAEQILQLVAALRAAQNKTVGTPTYPMAPVTTNPNYRPYTGGMLTAPSSGPAPQTLNPGVQAMIRAIFGG
jgi:hypothetical protein